MAWLIVVAIIAVAGSRRFTRPAWLLATVAAGHHVGLMAMMVVAQGNEQRYLLPVKLLLFAALTLVLLPSDQLGSVSVQVSPVSGACCPPLR